MQIEPGQKVRVTRGKHAGKSGSVGEVFARHAPDRKGGKERTLAAVEFADGGSARIVVENLEVSP